MDVLLGAAVIWFLAEMLWPARTDNGQLVYSDYQEPQKAKRRVILDEFGRPVMYVPEDYR